MIEDAWSLADRQFMAQALQLAALGLYSTDPNPRVGCVLAHEQRVVGTGWHRQAGSPHAEVHALREAAERARGATAYVTLEPCSHTGRTPPCADALIAAGVTRVVVAMQDPNPLVAGQGLARLRAAGIDVSCGLLQDEAAALNPGFIKRMTVQRPLVRIKLAMSLDGRTAMASGESQWITGPQARDDVQRLRARSSAIVTGIGTVLADDPQLSVRNPGLAPAGLAVRQPLRVVLDRAGRLPGQCALLKVEGPLWWVVDQQTDLQDRLIPAQVKLHRMDAYSDTFLPQLLADLAAAGCNELLVEAGPELAGAFIRARLCDELVVYMAPKLLGSLARPLALLELESMAQAIELELSELRQLGSDLRLRYRLR